MTRQEINKAIVNYLQPYHPQKIGIFGSIARNEETPENDLSEILGRKVDLVYIEHIQSCIDRIISYVEGFDYDSFINNQLIQDAIVRRLEIIGEATKRISV
jgi:predicted nucleotidyltransferase